MKKTVKCLLTLLLITANLFAHEHEEESQLEIQGTEKLTNNIYLMKAGHGGAVSNGIFLIGDKGVFLVDARAPKTTTEIIKSLTDRPITHIVNTHWHFDHCLGNIELNTNKNIEIIAHKNTLEHLKNGAVHFSGRKLPPLPIEAQPTKSIDDELKMKFGNEQIKIFHLPHGHTDGDVAVYFETSNIIALGDQFFHKMFPIADGNSGGNIVNYSKNLMTVLNMINKETVVVPGHGPLGTFQDLRNLHKRLESMIRRVKKAIQKNIPLQAAIQRDLLKKQLRGLDKGFINKRFLLQTLYRDVQKLIDKENRQNQKSE